MQWDYSFRGNRILKNFEEYINEGIVKEQYQDKSRARFIINESEKAYQFLKKIIKNIKFTDDDADTVIKISYDIIMGVIRAIMLSRGFSASGLGAHEAEVSYLKELEFTENEIQFADQLRFFRNGITYYGKKIDKEYAEKVLIFLEKIYPRLIKISKIH
jgi:hypothetical protein